MADQQAVADEHFQIRQVSVLIISRLTVSDITLSFSVPVVLSGTGAIPPATAVNYIPWALIGFIFNFVIRKRAFNWWAKYNCELLALCRASRLLIKTGLPPSFLPPRCRCALGCT